MSTQTTSNGNLISNKKFIIAVKIFFMSSLSGLMFVDKNNEFFLVLLAIFAIPLCVLNVVYDEKVSLEDIKIIAKETYSEMENFINNYKALMIKTMTHYFVSLLVVKLILRDNFWIDLILVVSVIVYFLMLPLIV